MIRTVLTLVLLTGMWVALWGDAALGTVLGGVVAATAVILIVPNTDSDRRLVFRPVQVVKFVGFFVYQLLASTLHVARLVLSSRAPDVRGAFLTIQLAERSYAVRTLIAHSISLTPGTLTVDVGADGRTLHVHVIEAADEQSARASIAALERRACQAFAPELDDRQQTAAEVD